MSEPADLRVSDAEREAVARALREHAAAGRLDTDELEHRLERAYMAEVRSQLDALVADLPAPPPQPQRRRLSDVARIKLAWVVVLVAIWAVSGAGYFWPVWVIPFLLFGAFTKRSSCRGGRARGGPPWSPRPRRSRLA